MWSSIPMSSAIGSKNRHPRRTRNGLSMSLNINRLLVRKSFLPGSPFVWRTCATIFPDHKRKASTTRSEVRSRQVPMVDNPQAPCRWRKRTVHPRKAEVRESREADTHESLPCEPHDSSKGLWNSHSHEQTRTRCCWPKVK